MQLDVLDLLRSQRALALFLVIGVGYLVGRLRLAGVPLGPATGVLLGGLVLGHLGIEGLAASQSVGFMLFIYCVGLQAGPQFFSVVREDGARFAALALVVGGSAFLLVFLLDWWLALSPGFGAGMVAGALTSTPTLVAAQDAVRTGTAILPAGVTPAAALENVSVAYAITYVFGMVGLVLLVGTLPRLFGIDVAAEAGRLEAQRNRDEASRGVVQRAHVPIVRVYRVEHDAFVGAPPGDPRFLERTGCLVQQVKRAGVLMPPDPELRLERGDLVAVLGSRRDQAAAREVLGPEWIDDDLIETAPETVTMVVTRSGVVGRHLAEIGITGLHGCLLVGLTRAGIALPLAPDLVVQKGDLATVTGDRANLERLAEHVGAMERPGDESDLFTFAFGIAAGILLGTVSVRVGSVSIELGSAGGLLLSGLVIGFLRSSHPAIGKLPVAASNVLMELGLLFFMANVGLQAGSGIVASFAAAGPRLVAGGVVLTTLPVLLGFAFGHRVLGIHPAVLLGALTGAMTSTPALAVVNRLARSSIPTLGYAGTYAFANVLLAFLGGLLMRL